MPFKIIRDDITRVRADAIVNTANPEPRWGRGTDGAVYQAAGAEQLLAARQKIGRIAPGECAATPAFALPARTIIHTVGPAWEGGSHGEFAVLRSCYRESLRLADQLGCRSIAFPLIATGTYGFPKDKALEIASETIRDYLKTSDLDVTLVVFNREAYQLAEGLSSRVEAYIDERYAAAKAAEEYNSRAERMMADLQAQRRLEQLSETWKAQKAFSSPPPPSYSMPHPSAAKPAASAPGAGTSAAHPKAKKPSLDEVVKNLGESFRERLFRMIDERGMSDPEVYKRANLDKKVFSKIRCNEDYMPKKKTVLALAIGLRLNLDDCRDLLASAGYSLMNSSVFDLIVSFCIENEIYDIFEVNQLLFQYGQPYLGASME